MKGFEDVVGLLVEKRNNLQAEKEAAINEAINKIDLDFAEREVAINKMLDECGYEEPVFTSTVAEDAEEQTEEIATESEEVASEETPVM